MPDSVTYEFAVIRVVPRVEREEFLNVGVMLFSKRKKYLGIRYKIDETRLRHFSPDMDIDLIKRHLRAWELVCQGGPEGGPIGQFDLPSRFRWLTAARSTIIQCSKVHPGMCDDPERVLEGLFERYVGKE